MSNVRRFTPAAFVVSAVVLALIGFAIYLFFVTTKTGQLLDARAFEGATLGQRSLEPVTLGLLDSIPIVGVAIAFVFAVSVSAIRRNWIVLFVSACGAGTANVLTQLLKNVILPRPDFDVPGYAFNSLPSGHTTVAASAAMVVFFVSSPRMRPVVAAAGALFTIVVGASTLANQWHRPSDVIASLLVVALCGCLSGAVLLAVQPELSSGVSADENLVWKRTHAWNRVLLWIALPCLAVAILALVVSTVRPLPLLASPPFAYAGGVMGIAASVLLLAVAANRAFRSVG